MDHVIGEHEDETVLVAERVEPDAPGIGVLVDESLAMAVDEDAPGQAVGRPQGQRAFERAEPRRRCTRADTHADAAAVVVRGPDTPGGVGHVGQRAQLGHHRLVVDEPSGGEDHSAASPDGPSAFVALDENADGLASVDDERLGPGIRRHASGTARDSRTESLHEESSGGVDVLRLVPAWHRDCDLIEGIGVLSTAEEQAGIIG